MSDSYIALVIGFLIFLASLISVETGISVALIEITMGVIGGNFLKLSPTPWLTFLSGFGGILLTFLAGAEVDRNILREKAKESLLIGGFSFLIPFLGVTAYCCWIANWSVNASLIAGIALSTTSLAVVYAVLVETGLTNYEIGKIIMASCFITDLGTALTLSLIFAEFNAFTLIFAVVSILVIFVMPMISPSLFSRYGERVIEPEIKFLFFILFLFIYVAKLGASHAILPAFVTGLVLSKNFCENRLLQRKLRIIAFGMVTPFFFIAGGINISLKMLSQSFGLFVVLFGVKQATKIIGIYPFARRYVPKEAVFTTLLMSTGLTMGTISAIFGLSSGIIDRGQFSVLVAVVVMSAILPTFIAQKWFHPSHVMSEDMDHTEKQDKGGFDV
ncbi:MAG: cation:proton antiporter [Proteobacteria bacterium]|nr:cation:proton antiporter [Pseudomonadota bacterium]